MEALLTTVPWETIGPAGLLALVVAVIIRGDLVPRKTHDAIIEYYRQTNDHLTASNARLETALSPVAHEYGTTADRVLNALPTSATKEDADA